MKYNFSNNLQVSPIVENKSAAGILMTPQRMNLHDLSNFGGTTPHIPFDFKDMKMDSPFQANSK